MHLLRYSLLSCDFMRLVFLFLVVLLFDSLSSDNDDIFVIKGDEVTFVPSGFKYNISLFCCGEKKHPLK